MGIFRRFERGDVFFSTISTRPSTEVSFGEDGWKGSRGVSSSISMFGGVRSRDDINDVGVSGLEIVPISESEVNAIEPIRTLSGSYPKTASIEFFRCVNQEGVSDNETLYEQYYRPIEILFDDYSTIDSNYYIGCSNFYSLLLLSDIEVTAGDHPPGPVVIFPDVFPSSLAVDDTSSLTAESWVKLLPYGSDQDNPFPHNPVILCEPDVWNISVTDEGFISLGTGSQTGSYFLSSSNKIKPGIWSHVAVSVESGLTASYYLDGKLLGTGSVELPSPSYDSTTSSFVVGGLYDDGSYINSLNGFIFETRLWSSVRTEKDIRNSLTRNVSPTSQNLSFYAKYSEGPLVSDVIDYSANEKDGTILNWSGDHRVRWRPNDHPTFIPNTGSNLVTDEDLRLVTVPSLFYGKQIDPGSVTITDGVLNTRKVVGVIKDDGRGTLYVSGSLTSDVSGEDYAGERRRKVGNVFYSEGLVVFTDPSLREMFDSGSIFWDQDMEHSGTVGDLFSLQFKGQTKVRTRTFNCRIHSGELNASNNPTYSEIDEQSGKLVVKYPGKLYMTSIGIYDHEFNLVAVAKLAQPIRKRDQDKINIRLRLDVI